MSHVNIIVVDDYPLFRDGMYSVLKKYCPENTVHKASGIKELTGLIRQYPLSIVFIELKVPIIKGFEEVRSIRSANKNVRIVVVSAINQGAIIRSLFDDGISCYLHKDSNWNNLKSIINLILSGQFYISPKIFVQFNEQTGKIENRTEPDAGRNQLSLQEKRLVSYFCKQLDPDEIARKLTVSKHHVELLKESILIKTNSKNLIGLAIYARQHGLIND